MKILYFHGGPGLNSNPEENLLLSRFEKIGFDPKFYNEPSLLRPNGPAFKEDKAFQNYLDCAEEFLLQNYQGMPLVLMGHSFGAHPICHLVKRHLEKVAKVVFISTNLSLADADINLFTFIMQDYKEHGDNIRYMKLKEVLKNYTGKFDQNTETGFILLGENPRFFNYYWFNKERMQVFLSYYQLPEFGIDVNAFLIVRRAYYEMEFEPVSIPAIAFFGKKDIVTPKDAEITILKRRFPKIVIHEFENSAHYSHIEETDRFLEIIRER